jgi:uncharacterized repeat protein (TIGR01451 family)
VPGNPDPSLGIDKAATTNPAVDAGRLKIGDKVAYHYTIYNVGNVDIARVSVTDPTIGPVSCPTPPAPGLTPGQRVTCTAQTAHTVTQADVDAGTVTDTATAGCTDALGEACGPSNRSTVPIPTVAPAPLTSVKKIARVAPAADQRYVRLGDKIHYSFKVTNIGNVDLARVSVSDPALGPVDCPARKAPGLAPRASETCTGRRAHTVTRADLKRRQIINQATATGVDPRGQVSAVSRQARATVRAGGQRLQLRKVASTRVARAGQTITYTLTVSNPGGSAVAHVIVCDALPARLVYVAGNPRAHLSVGRYCWTIARLAGHASRKLHIRANVAPQRRGGVTTNRATASAQGVATAHAAATVHLRPVSPVVCPSYRTRGPDVLARMAC